MKKHISLILALTLLVSLLSGCAGTTVVVGNCTCPTEGPAVTAPAAQAPAEGALKTGLAVVTSVFGSAGVTEAEAGKASYDVTVAAVTVDENGIIRGCYIDSLGTDIKFDAAGSITTDLDAKPATKNELGEAYGMKAATGKLEWNEQAAVLADFAIGKTVEEFKAGTANPGGDADLLSSATIYIGGYVAAVEKAVANAQHLGAQSGDELKVAVLSKVSGANAAAEQDGNAQLDADVVALTMNGDTISSCYLDSVQAKVSFDAAGALKTDVSAPVLTKNELGDNYNMVAWGGAQFEWNVQAANFAAYVTGKTLADVTGIAVNEQTYPTDADLTTKVTIAIGGFQALIAKAIG